MIKDRAFKAVNLGQYYELNKMDELGVIELNPPDVRQYVLRMLIKRMFDTYYKLPGELDWVRPMIEMAEAHQRSLGIRQPYVYLTIRNGVVNTKTDDTWHVDGFSQTITHLPEQNYIWTDKMPTEYVEKSFAFPSDFDSAKHNIHSFFNKRIEDKDILTMKAKTVYGMDPYIVHRRPTISQGVNRCFIRVSFTPIEIEDVNNTHNDLIPTDYKRDGIRDMRSKLVDYDK